MEMARLGGRIGRLLKASAEALLTPAEDPRTAYAGPEQQQLLLMEQVQAAAERLKTIRTRLQDRREDAAARIAAFEEEAKGALVAGHEQEARIALQRERIAHMEIEQLDRQIVELVTEEVRLAAAIQRISARMEQLRARQRLAAARHTAARAHVEIGEALAGVDAAAGESIAVDRIERDADALEARADAIEELIERGVFGRPQLEPSGWPEDKAADAEIDERLAALKRDLVNEQAEQPRKDA
jgi:phage shock protein A